MHVSAAVKDTVDVDAPDGAGVPGEGAEPFAVQRVPHTRGRVLRAAEQQVTLAVVLDLRDRTVVAVQHQRLL